MRDPNRCNNSGQSGPGNEEEPDITQSLTSDCLETVGVY